MTQGSPAEPPSRSPRRKAAIGGIPWGAVGLASLAVLFRAVQASAQLAATVPSSDPVNRVIEEIRGMIPIPGAIAGQRPLSRRELARIARTASAYVQRARAQPDSSAPLVTPRVERLVAMLAAAAATDIRHLDGGAPTVSGVALETVSLSAIATDSRRVRILPVDNGLGGIDAFTNPLTDGRWGRPIADGGTLSAEGSTRVGWGAGLAAGAQVRVSGLDDRDVGTYTESGVQRLYLRGVFHNLAVEAGLDEHLWGQGGSRGMLLSANPRPLHAITIANDTAVVLPSIFRYLGPVRAIVLAADLGRQQNFPGAKLVGYKVSAAPTPFIELGASILSQLGGGGAPASSLGERVKSLFPFIFLAVQPGSDRQASNRIAGLDARVRFPSVRGLSLYYELDIDDFDLRRRWSTYWQDSGHILGASLPRLSSDGAFFLAVEAHHTSLRQYRHHQFRSGWTYHQAIMGDPLGPNAAALYATLGWHPGDISTVTISGALESRDPSQFTATADVGTDDHFTFVRLTDEPRERRVRILLNVDRSVLGTGTSLTGGMGAERAVNDAFTPGRRRTSFLVEAHVRHAF